ncbi:PucR C-terminal helix-turn-helix domain-containing protein [Actinacidiphila yanglinensis]|uniref:PucR C-terminal helix-turn-helix domain-containing protein n=1 Tax=Actinacidiphila yanglinensis TaxID=310779 RepID=A0A1H6E640_9ACTN|nr:helix-turn-helix domain-containing protein [Actinacidiphila yanglinensis]SEG93107.1 PucR C-terminal helix-turn-helix domain-containing protein [Actinacidiphila yanglinensis]
MHATEMPVHPARDIRGGDGAAGRDEPARRDWRGPMVRSVADAIVDQAFAGRPESPSFRARITHVVHAHLGATGILGRAAADPGRTVEEEAAAFGGWLAEQQIPGHLVHEVYWTGMRRTLQLWAEAGWPGLASPAGAPGPVPGERVTRATQRAMELTERATAAAKAEHCRITATLRVGGDLRRNSLAREILDGAHDAVTLDLDATLGYRLSSTHVAVLLDVESREEAERVLRGVAAAAGARDRLLVPMSAPQWAGWLGFSTDPGRRGLAAVQHALRGAGGSSSMSGARSGINGFRRSFAEARRVEAMRPVLAPGADHVLCFTELALESVLLSDVDAARTFAVDELGELAEPTDRAARLRTTLSVWLSCGSQTLTASRLGIHENTVRLRIATATRTLGPSLLERRTELLIALRLCRVVGMPEPAAPGRPSPR